MVGKTWLLFFFSQVTSDSKRGKEEIVLSDARGSFLDTISSSLETGTGSLGQWSQHQSARGYRAFGEPSQAHGGILGLSCAGSGDGLDDPCCIPFNSECSMIIYY